MGRANRGEAVAAGAGLGGAAVGGAGLGGAAARVALCGRPSQSTVAFLPPGLSGQPSPSRHSHGPVRVRE